MAIENKYKYFAFISYKREDEEWAVWFQHELEYYHLPALLNGREDLPKVFRPVFRDIDELRAGNLPEQIHEALASSAYLIVICSPRSAKSEWVNKEIEAFIEIGKERGINNLDHIFPFIVEGIPHAPDETHECFPKALRDLPADQERIGGNVNESGRDKAFIKVMAGMLPNVGMDTLWNRYERDKAETERKEREQKNKLFISQSRLIGEKALSIANDDSYLARLLACEVLPKDLESPDRPYVFEAERALRQACLSDNTVFRGHTDFVNTAFFSPDDKMLVSASNDQTVKIWDSNTGREIHTMKGHTAAVTYATFSPEGSHIASSSDDSTVRIWNAKTGEGVMTLYGHKAGVNSVVFSPSGQLILSASKDGTAVLWDASTGAIEHELLGHMESVNSAAFNSDGSMIVTASDDKTVKIWDTLSGKEIKTLVGFNVPVTCAVFSLDGHHVYSVCERYCENENIALLGWNVDTGEIIVQDRGGSYGNIISSSHNKEKYLSSNTGATIHDSSFTFENCLFLCDRHRHYVTFASFSSKDNVVTASEDCTLRTWHIPRKIINTDFFETIISPNGKLILTNTVDNTLAQDNPKKYQLQQLRLWDTLTGCELTFLENTIGAGTPAAFSKDNRLIAFSKFNETWAQIVLFDLLTKTEIRRFSHNSAISSINFSSDEKRLVSADISGTIKVWETQIRKELLSWAGGENAIFSPNNKQIASYSSSTIYLWDAESGTLIRTFEGHKGFINSVNFSSDSKQLVSCSDDHSVIIWDVESGKNKLTYQGHADSVNFAMFSPDDRHILSFPGFRPAIVWDAKTGADVLYIYRSDNQNMTFIVNACFCPDGKRILAVLSDGCILSVDFPPLQDLIDQTRERFKDRPLTPKERRMYYLE